MYMYEIKAHRVYKCDTVYWIGLQTLFSPQDKSHFSIATLGLHVNTNNIFKKET